MKLRLALTTLSLALFACHAATAQAPAGAPAGATGQCKDGTYSMAASKSGACGGHKGVGTWYTATAAKPAAAPAKPAPAPAPAAAATKPAAAPAPKPAPAPAASTAGAPAGANGVCKDGTYSMAASKSGACGGHKGVQTWFAAATPSPAAKTAAAPAPAPAPAPAAKPAAAPAPAAANIGSQSSGSGAGKMPAVAAAGGGPGMVWVNTASKVYHCPTDRYYGKTKAGKYVTESAAQAEGDKPDAGKKCN